MGIEYRNRFEVNPTELDRRLRALRFFVKFDAAHRIYLLNVGAPADESFVSGWVSIEEDGLYFCDHLGGTPMDRVVVFRAVIDFAFEQSETVKLEML
jgi:hypothetical protein